MVKPRILIVDDEPFNLVLLAGLLEGEGYGVESAASGSEALRLVQAAPPDLVILDVMMPGMTGFEVCEVIRNDPTLCTLPILFLSALDDQEAILKGSQVLADDYLTKPLNSALLVTKVKNILRLHSLRQKSMAATSSEAAQQKLDAALSLSEDLLEKFRLFVPDNFMRRIAPQGLDSIRAGNVRQEEMTILMADLRGFTTLSEQQPPEVLVQWLNPFFNQMGEAIAYHQGFIDKFMGDAILAIFDRPDRHSADALGAALEMQQRLRNLNGESVLYSLPAPLRMGIGIHSGVGLIGTIGSDGRLDSTVIGDVVNTAARLEELTKEYDRSILLSGDTVDRLPSPQDFRLEFLGEVIPRGKQTSLQLYALSDRGF